VQVVLEATRALKPRVVVVENVPAFLTRQVRHPSSGGAVSAATILIDELADNYVPFSLLADLADYGVPQTRKRAFITFVHKAERGLVKLRSAGRAPFPRPTHSPDYGGAHVVLGEAMASWGLPPLDAVDPESSRSDDPLHNVPVWDPRHYAMVAAIPGGAGGSAWDNQSCERCGPATVARDDATCPSCRGPLLRPVVVDAAGETRLIRGFRNSSYRRMRPDAPAATITTASGHIGSDRTLHPTANRVLSPRECALLQTFPVDFKWGNSLEAWGATNVRAMIGEAVPPMFTALHGKILASVLNGVQSPPAISLTDPRILKAADALARAESAASGTQKSPIVS
jgi:DNA (cytosine-5)-methyltransferase 1